MHERGATGQVTVGSRADPCVRDADPVGVNYLTSQLSRAFDLDGRLRGLSRLERTLGPDRGVDGVVNANFIRPRAQRRETISATA
jgi:hypothetical protein